MPYIELREGDLVARINNENQQLCSLQFKGKEYMHGGGKPAEDKSAEDLAGWQNSEIIMFPIVGPAHEGKLNVNGEDYLLGQHGIVRHLNAITVMKTPYHVTFRYDYDGTPVPSKTNPGEIYNWLPFSLEKTFMLENSTLQASFTVRNIGSEPMPYMLGWHPAFRASEDGVFEVVGKKHSLSQVREISGSPRKALTVHDSLAVYIEEGRYVAVSATCGNTMLWSPHPAMFCIEPVTQLQKAEGLKDVEGMNVLKPGESAHYSVSVLLR